MGNKNPCPKILALATANILDYKMSKPEQAKKRGKQQNNNESNTSKQDEGQTFLVVGGSPDNVHNEGNNKVEQNDDD